METSDAATRLGREKPNRTNLPSPPENFAGFARNVWTVGSSVIVRLSVLEYVVNTVNITATRRSRCS